MQASRLFAVIVSSAIVVCAAMLLLLPESEPRVLMVILGGITALSIVPLLLIRQTQTRLNVVVSEKDFEVKQLNDEMNHLKTRFAAVTKLDELTGCSNKKHFMEILGQHRGMSERSSYAFTIAVTQVDQFAGIVENQGMERGHEVLQLFSRIVKAALREVDAIARLDMDKFGLLLSGCSEHDALEIINRIGQLVSQIQVNDQDDVKITASGGITSYHGTETAEDLIDHAEQALAFAISQGRDRVAGYNYADPAEETA